MEVKHISAEGTGYIIFENVFLPDELNLIWKEANFLCDERKLKKPEHTGSAKDKNGFKKDNRGIFLDEIYTDRSYSNYLSLYTKPWNFIHTNKQELLSKDPGLNWFFHTRRDTTLMSYYENEHYYKSHTDSSVYTSVFWLFKEPKKFTGGDFTFEQIGHTIETQSNMAVLFPSWMKHKVDKIMMCESVPKFESNGRFAFSSFLT